MRTILRDYDPEADFESAFFILRDVIGGPPYESARHEFQTYPGRKSVAKVVTSGGRLVGFCAATFPHWNGVALLDYLAVAADSRANGIGSQLVRELEAALTEQALRLVAVQTASWNEKAIRFYERLGYTRRALMPAYLGPDNDLVWLDRPLT